MKILSSITENKDIVSKDYADSKAYSHPSTHDISMITDNAADNVFSVDHKIHQLMYFKNNNITDISHVYSSGFYGTKNTDGTTPYAGYWFIAVFCKDPTNQIAVQWAMNVGKTHNGELWMRTIRLNAETTADGNMIGTWERVLNKNYADTLYSDIDHSHSYNDLTDKPDISDYVRATTSVSFDNTSNISIPLTIENTNTLAVYQNGLLLTPTTHYTATTTSITLVGYTANAGDIFTFVSKDIPAGNSLNVAADTILFSDSSDCYGECATVQQALTYIAENWQPPIKEITLNGSQLTPDTNGAVALPDILCRDGGTMTGSLSLSGDPTSNLHAATKKYVDDKVTSAINSAITTALAGDY